MILKLTPEIRAALAAQPGQPLEMIDDETKQVYVLFERRHARDLLDRWILQELSVGEADVAAGRITTWNPDVLGL